MIEQLRKSFIEALVASLTAADVSSTGGSVITSTAITLAAGVAIVCVPSTFDASEAELSTEGVMCTAHAALTV